MSQADDIVAAIEKELARAVTDATLEVTSRLIESTPVDTGFARASWIPSVGQPLNTSAAAEKGSFSEVVAAQYSGQVAVLQYKLSQGSVFITNAARYIGRLNDGSSTQQAAGFVERAIDEGTAAAQAHLNERLVKL